MAFISMQGISLAFISVPLFDGVNLTIERGEKVGLVGSQPGLHGYLDSGVIRVRLPPLGLLGQSAPGPPSAVPVRGEEPGH